MAYQIKTGTSDGNPGFSGNGILKNFKDWVVKTPANGGPGWYIIDDQSSLGTDPYIVICTEENPTPNGVQKTMIVKDDTSEGKIVAQACLYWNSSTHMPRCIFSGQAIDIISPDYDFRGGGDLMVINVGSPGTSGYSYGIFLGDWEPLPGLVETDVRGVLKNGVLSGSNVTLTLTSGEAEKFTAEHYYFIFDFNGHTWVNYVRCVSVNASLNQIVVDPLTHNYPAGAVISSYEHKFIFAGSRGISESNLSWNQNNNLPYCQGVTQSGVHHDQVSPIEGRTYLRVSFAEAIDTTPTDSGVYVCSRILITGGLDFNGDPEFNARFYGYIKNVAVTSWPGVNWFNTRTIEGNSWIFLGSGLFANLGGYPELPNPAVMLPNYNSL